MPARLHTVAYGALLLVRATLVVWADEFPPTWGGDYPPCERHAELLKHEHKDLGVRFATSDSELVAAFAHAMDFWASILDMEWHEEGNRNCSIQIVDGRRDLFEAAQVARAQFPQQPAFQGLVAFNPKSNLSESEKYVAAVHELGHLLGLPHNVSAQSVMFYLLVDGPVSLDAADLGALAARHTLRPLGRETALMVDPISIFIACNFANIQFVALSLFAIMRGLFSSRGSSPCQTHRGALLQIFNRYLSVSVSGLRR